MNYVSILIVSELNHGMNIKMYETDGHGYDVNSIENHSWVILYGYIWACIFVWYEYTFSSWRLTCEWAYTQCTRTYSNSI